MASYFYRKWDSVALSARLEPGGQFFMGVDAQKGSGVGMIGGHRIDIEKTWCRSSSGNQILDAAHIHLCQPADVGQIMSTNNLQICSFQPAHNLPAGFPNFGYDHLGFQFSGVGGFRSWVNFWINL
jgi:hypothetical protein